MAENIFGVDDSTYTAAIGDDLIRHDFSDADTSTLEKADDTTKPTPPKPTPAPAKPAAKQTAKKLEEEDDEEEEEETPKPPAKPQFKAPEKFEEFFDEDISKDKSPATAPEGDDAEDEEEETSASPFEAYSKQLYDLNIFDSEIDEEGNEIKPIAKTAEEFKDLFESQSIGKARTWLTNFLTQHGDDRKEFFDAVFMDGVPPEKYFSVARNVESFETLSLEEESNQEKVVREFYKRARLSDDKINAKVQRLKDISELQSEAENLHPLIVEQDKQTLETMRTQEKQKLAQEEREDTLYKQSVAKILNEKIKAKDFDGIPVSEKAAQKVYDMLYNKKWKTPEGKKLTDLDVWWLNLNKPENHALKVKLAFLAENNLDLTKVKQKSLSNATNALFSDLAGKKAKQNKTPKAEDGLQWGSEL